MGIGKDEIKKLIGEKEKIVIFEIGCADGVDSKDFLTTFGDNLMLYTFDPEPINIQIMTKEGMFDAQGNSNNSLVSDARHIFSPYALCDKDGTVEFNRSRNTAGEGGGYFWGRYSGSIRKPKTHLYSDVYGNRWPACVFDEVEEVSSIRLDTFCKNNDISSIDFLWMDVQGAEKDVFSGAQNMLKNINYVYTEFYNEEMYSGCVGLEEIKSLLPNFEVINIWSYHDADGGDVLFRNMELK